MTEPQRLQYLQAMGVTAWVGRYRLPNAAESMACEWPEPSEDVKPSVSQLQAALVETSPPAPSYGADEASTTRPGRARALLEGVADSASQDEVPLANDRETIQERSSDDEQARPDIDSDDAPQALRFSLQVASLDGRWLVILPDGTPPSSLSQRLLANIFRAAGIECETGLVFQSFHWPMIEELPVHEPLEEAREGLRAFVDGRRRGGWRLERVLLFGHAPVLEDVLAITEGHSTLLGLPAWQGPALETLAQDAGAKRSLLPMLSTWQVQWFQAADDGD
ncbi:hypothetical protein [Aidingimonas halophila]|uniref:Uncharacterized protein n=1 Tax=Aidingimonas halophila TaxID=574349 RepID=A0A1H2VQM8_9GAMM|nr:hypothetical protein [Aidingimonas halophila]GHC24689.1 hypothetical protein GCM10008094_14740 [Aidingimonas halophila]SDW70633.1 hypothetical protein SAMN05443545_102473 [Aidingimonas halophila]